MTVDIPFSQWDRGQGDGLGCFYTEADNKCRYCVMGFVLKALGVPTEVMKELGSLSELPHDEVIHKVPDAFYAREHYDAHNFVLSSDVTSSVTDTNDDPRISDDERMERLALFLEPVGIDLVFIKDEPSCM